ncbi:hypothetical protein CEXT_402091 [Caerostris extrusa]|uniref:Uncharacterized protein n=1 Tax=Caerostris extrusa TaxID=172846 RepID=A0AAV4W4I5_CAEEX|nr:hypothetical protein CEXT_402091 [Caerostris extrusa]
MIRTPLTTHATTRPSIKLVLRMTTLVQVKRLMNHSSSLLGSNRSVKSLLQSALSLRGGWNHRGVELTQTFRSERLSHLFSFTGNNQLRTLFARGPRPSKANSSSRANSCQEAAIDSQY